ncbi:UDP-N-acetylglucosamine transferase subunit [Ascosphaera acerosa]|nr:UDP-N-acetylglucosamine transferase subunit [Ascosphaera acerosa]
MLLRLLAPVVAALLLGGALALATAAARLARRLRELDAARARTTQDTVGVPPPHLLIVLGSGGHTAEMLQMLARLPVATAAAAGTTAALASARRTYVVSSGDALSARKAGVFEQELRSPRYAAGAGAGAGVEGGGERQGGPRQTPLREISPQARVKEPRASPQASSMRGDQDVKRVQTDEGDILHATTRHRQRSEHARAPAAPTAAATTTAGQPTPSGSPRGATTRPSSPSKPSYCIVTVPRARKVHQSLLTAPFSTLRCLGACLRLFIEGPSAPALDGEPWRLPDVVLANGPATALCVVVAARLVRALLCVAAYLNPGTGHDHGWVRAVSQQQQQQQQQQDLAHGQRLARQAVRPRIIYVESWARVTSLSLSGRLAMPLADRFLVQWQGLAGVPASAGRAHRWFLRLFGRKAEYVGVLV